MRKYKEIKALGFVEVMIAIVVAGIVSTVFLTVAGKAMKELVQTERIEAMRRVAKDGVEIAQEVANKQKNALPTEEFFPTGAEYCFIPFRDTQGDYSIMKNVLDDNFVRESIPKSNEASLAFRNWAINNAIYDENLNEESDDPYFLIMCIEDIDVSGTRWANVYFLVGDKHVEGKITSDTDLKDFKYYAIIDL